MSSVSSFDFSEAWAWAGWTAFNETTTGGAIDADGSLLLVGTLGYEATSLDDDTFVDATGGDFAAVKLLSSGEVLWTWTDSSSGSYFDSWHAVDTDSNNDVIMGGKTEGYWADWNSDEVMHMAVVKLEESTGDELWRYQESPPDSWNGFTRHYGKASVLGVAVDSDDNIFLVGQVFGSLEYGEGDPGDSDAHVVKLDGTDGSEILTQQIGDGLEFDSLRDAKADSAGDLVAVGVRGQLDSIDIVALKLSGTDGSTLWEYSPSSATIDVLLSVDVDSEGDVYVAGGFGAENIQGSIAEMPVVLKLDGSTGDVVWTYEGTAPSRAVFSSVGVDPVTGAIVGAGRTEGTWLEGAEQGWYDFAAVVLNGTTGEEMSRYQNGTNDYDYLTFAGFDPQGGLLVGGTSTVGRQEDAIAIKFGEPQGSDGESHAGVEVTPAPTVAATPSPTASATPSPTAGVRPSPTVSATPSPTVGATPDQTAAVTPSTTAVAIRSAEFQDSADEGLAEWEIGSIVGGLALLLLLLACAGCFLRKKKNGAQVQHKDEAPRQEPPPAEAVAAPASCPPAGLGAIPASPPPAYVEASPAVLPTVGATPAKPPPAFASQPPPAPRTPPTDASILPPSSEDVDVSDAHSSPSPRTDTDTPPEEAAKEAPVETAAQRLAKRKVPLPNNTPAARSYAHVPISMYKPFAPVPTNP